MALNDGTRLGPYEITGALGAGGMGEVYRGHDSRLKRDVALKILPSTLAADPERLARFEREAQTLAAINHPNIAAIYGLEDSDGVRALVLELVEGETLAERIARGKLPVEDALNISRQIATALEVAHEQGIVHRDLKPANIKITPDGTVKVLDFGLAKLVTGSDAGRVPSSGFAGSKNQDPAYAAGHASGSQGPLTAAPTIGSSARPDVTASPTMTSPALMTGAGMLLGTAAYMAPEQARGRAVDKRADIWAFGVVLYEMLTGTRAFGGDSVTETAGAVIHKDLDWSGIPADLPPPARTILKRCLQKDPSQRVRDIGDVRLALDGAFAPDASATTTQSPPGSKRRLAEIVAVALLAAIAAGIGVWFLMRSAPPERYPVRAQIAPPGPNRMAPFVSLSPDGRHMAYVALDDMNLPRIWVHSLEAGEPRTLTSAGLVRSPLFWSPDSRYIGFATEGKLKKIDVSGGTAETVCDVVNMVGGTWTRSDIIVFADQSKGGILRVPAGGGTPVQLTMVDKARDEIGHFLPWALPDGRHFLYLRTAEDDGVFVGDIEAPPEQQSPTRLLAAAHGVVYVPGSASARGTILFLRGSQLMAQPFDESTRTLAGDVTNVIEQVASNEIFPSFGASENGTLAYLRASSDTGSLIWISRDGKELTPIASGLMRPQNPRLSPDGRSLAAVIGGEIWSYDLAGRPPIKVTFDGNHFSPIWSPDSTRILYEVGGARGIASVPADGSGGRPEQFGPLGHFHPHGWTSGGTDIVAVRMTDETYKSTDVVQFSSARETEPQTIVATPASEGIAGAVSPDGRWLAYSSDATGQAEIWVRPLPGPGAAVRISPNGGFEPLWARNGRELFYLENTNVMSVAVDTSNGFNFKPAVRLFERSLARSDQPPSYDVAADGRFVVVKPDAAADVPISVILNWPELVNRGAAIH